jgi:hypothetical protein
MMWAESDFTATEICIRPKSRTVVAHEYQRIQLRGCFFLCANPREFIAAALLFEQLICWGDGKSVSAKL